jgi:hypothetical protein
MARLARSLATLRDQLDAAFPDRSKRSDGWIGDAAHSARVSQHNPNSAGVVCAIDVTHDPANGVDCHRLMAELDASDDPRILYLIWNREIDNSDDSRTPYTGANSHTLHLHLSAPWDRPALYDDPRPWALPMLLTLEDDEMYSGPTAVEIAQAVLGYRIPKGGGVTGSTTLYDVMSYDDWKFNRVFAGLAGVADAVRAPDPVQFIESIKPLLLQVVAEALAADNDATAEAVVDAFAARIGAPREPTS